MIVFQTTTQTVHVQPLQPGYLNVGPFFLHTFYVHPLHLISVKKNSIMQFKSIEHDSVSTPEKG